MSLLLQALKRADAQKRQPATAGMPRDKVQTGPAIALALQDDGPDVDESAFAVPAHVGRQPGSEVESDDDEFALPPADAATSAARSVSAAQARAVFAAKTTPRRPGAWVSAFGAAIVMAGAGWLARPQPVDAPDVSTDEPLSTVRAGPAVAEPPVPIVSAAVAESVIVASPTPTPVVSERREAPGTDSESPRVEVRRSESAERVPAAVEAGFDAYRAGQWREAEVQYRRALQQDERSRDALLGLAATLVQQGRDPAAVDVYQRLARFYPDDSAVQAGLAALQRDGGERQRALLKQQADGGDAEAAFVLGNRLAADGRWAEAQAAYFQAYTQAPTSADYAYNLAVSLDHLQQTQPAAEFYRRALALAGDSPARFDAQAPRARLASLEATQ